MNLISSKIGDTKVVTMQKHENRDVHQAHQEENNMGKIDHENC